MGRRRDKLTLNELAIVSSHRYGRDCALVSLGPRIEIGIIS
jgi:hypothetical protein